MIEAFFCKYGYDYNKVRIEYGIREFAQHWYVGDGWFLDGMNFAFDYYNSYVIQPYLANIINVLNAKGRAYEWFVPKLDKISSEIITRDATFREGSYVFYRNGTLYFYVQ
jgi:hypothetical protein